MNDQTMDANAAARLLLGSGNVGPPKREADFDHRPSFRNDVGVAREIARNDPYGANAVRTKRSSVIGQGLKLALRPDYEALGVTVDAAMQWSLDYKTQWDSWCNSMHFDCDAQRKQTMTGLAWTLHDSLYVSGEAAVAMKVKKGFGDYETCCHVFEPERISTPVGKSADPNIRDGIERDEDGAPIAYHIATRRKSPFEVFGAWPAWKWDRVPRYNKWGRPQVIHSFSHIRPDMTRGVSAFASVIKQMRMLKEYSDVELQSAIAQAAWAAFIKTDLDYEDAMKVVGAQDPKLLSKYGGNPIAASMFGYTDMLSKYYGALGLKYQGGKVPHLAPNDSLEVLRSTHPNSQFSDFEGAMLRQFCAGLGVDYPALSKNYAEVNYSGARAALADIWRNYLCDRIHMSETIMMPIVACHMEEALIKGLIKPLGKMPWLKARQFLVRGSFTGWGKPMIDPDKEGKGRRLALDMGIGTRTKMAAEDGEDLRDIITERAWEESALKKAGLGPEVLMPELQPTDNADAPKNPENKT